MDSDKPLLRFRQRHYLTALLGLTFITLLQIPTAPQLQNSEAPGRVNVPASPQPTIVSAEATDRGSKPAFPAAGPRAVQPLVPTPPVHAPAQPSARQVPEVPDLPGAGFPPTLIHTRRRGEAITSLARHYRPQTSFMTVSELEAALRESNGGKEGAFPKPGEQVIIPEILTSPIMERPVPIPRNYEVRAIYLTGYMAGSEHGIRLIRRWHAAGGNAIVFDIKDFDGLVNVRFSHRLAPKRRDAPIRNLPKFVRFLHSLDLHAIARIALFRDEHIAKIYPELAVHSRHTGQAWRENGKLVWTDPSNPDVQDYNLALAKEVAASGVDEIQFDYVRFPAEGDQGDARFAFQSTHPEWDRSDVLSDFLSRTFAELHPLGVLVSLDVFGVMAWQLPLELRHNGQDISAIAPFFDGLYAMIHPSHFSAWTDTRDPATLPNTSSGNP